jgi:hypothetical protein
LEFIKANEYPSSFSASFVLYKDCSIQNINTKVNFQKENNEDNNIFFESELKSFIEGVNWIPGKVNGIPVNSWIHLEIYLK